MAGAIAGLVIALIVAGTIGRWEWRVLRGASAESVIRHLRHCPNSEYTVQLGSLGQAWDPAPRPSGSTAFPFVYGPGTASYRLTGDGQITLTFARTTGAEHRAIGPVPARLVSGTPEAARWRRIKRQLWFAVGAYPCGGAVGFVVGYFVTAATSSLRLQRGLLGAGIGFVCTAVLLHGTGIALGVRRATLHRSSTRPTDSR